MSAQKVHGSLMGLTISGDGCGVLAALYATRTQW